MANRRHHRADVERALARREAQGLTFDQLAQRTGIPAATLAYWSQKLRREAEEPAGGFVQLLEARRSSVFDTASVSGQESSVRIEHPSGAVIEFIGAAADRATDLLLEELTSWS